MDPYDFLEILNSEAFETEIKQIFLRIERILIPTLNENAKNDAKVFIFLIFLLIFFLKYIRLQIKYLQEKIKL